MQTSTSDPSVKFKAVIYACLCGQGFVCCDSLSLCLRIQITLLLFYFSFNDFIKTDKSLDTIQYKLHKHK